MGKTRGSDSNIWAGYKATPGEGGRGYRYSTLLLPITLLGAAQLKKSVTRIDILDGAIRHV